MNLRRFHFAIPKVHGIIAIMSTVQGAIRKAIAGSEKSRYRLWKETGISQAHLCEFLHGHRGMKIDTLELLAKALGLEIVVRPAKRKKGR